MGDRQPERILDLPHHSVGSAAEALVEAATAHGYTVAATGPGTYRLARTTRRMLVSKHTESVLAAVFEDRVGTKLRVVGDVDDLLLQRVGTAAVSPVTTSQSQAVPPVTDDRSRPPLPSVPFDPPASTVPPPRSPAPPVARPAPPAVTGASPALPYATQPPTSRPPGTPPSAGMITGLPGAVPRPEPLDVERTVARSAIGLVPSVQLPDGRSMSIDAPLVVGRDPDLSKGPTGAVAVPIADRSLSKTHLALTVEANTVRVTDLHSTNGTYVVTAEGELRCDPDVPSAVRGPAVIVAGDVRLELKGVR